MRSAAARIYIPACENPQRRERCLEDWELFLKTYFGEKYERSFEKIHRVIAEALIEVARYGGKQAVAAPRGFGKSEIVKGMIVYLIAAGLIRFPVPVCQTTAHAQELYEDFRDKVENSDLFCADFPEICVPVRELNRSPLRAYKQHIDGQLTRIEWKAERLRLADVPAKYRGPIDYGGVRMEFRGLDAAIRGINRKGDRPDFVPIDDPESRESAKSESQIRDRIKALDQDVNGLAGRKKRLAQCMITTIQNTYCLSYKYVNNKASWMGKRFGWVEKWPDEWNANPDEPDKLWNEYIAQREKDQQAGDRFGKNATKLFLDNRRKMERGGELMDTYFEPQFLDDGTQVIHSPWQIIFNEIADTSFDAFCTEYQNDPPESEEIQTLALTHGKVASSLSGLQQGEIPPGVTCTTLGIDVGKYESWFAKIAWDENATGWVVDYGQIRTVGLDKFSSGEAIETALMQALSQFAEEQSEADMPPLLTLVDSGDYSDAIYEVCHRLRVDNYFPAKGGGGQGRAFTMPKPTQDKQPFLEAYASRLYDDKRREFWLYNVNTEWWKNWLQERWLQPTFTDKARTLGSMALFEPEHGDTRLHSRFAKSMVSERLEHVPMPDKGYKAKWTVVDRRNNHWLDAAALACAAAGCVGIRLVKQAVKQREASIERREKKEQKPSPFSVGGRPYLVTQR